MFEGVVGGDEYQIIKGDEISLEMHPFAEIVDVWLRDDNGNVVFEFGTGFGAVDPRRLVLVDRPISYERKVTLSSPLRVPDIFDLRVEARVEHVIPARQDGEIVVIDTGEHTGADIVVGWRIDGRIRKDIVGLSRHSHVSLALKEAHKFARDFLPPYGPKKNRPRDEQRERLYLWEHSFKSRYREFENLSEAQELASEICNDLGISDVTVKAGRKNLTDHSYYKGGAVVLAADMVDNHTTVHEVAHHVVARLKGPRQPPHGPRFAGVLLALMVRYMGVDEAEALEKAEERDIIVDRDVLRAITARLEPQLESGLKI
ncbi:hypothetical protein [Rhizobium sp. MHM7A]|uniref:hypothetical protein n=1 Tax=Rhizobium sp. MHM7A TaxID=2583233 RepID=UPI0011066680|nr:hypothetical protein [Rhizobium sp. MHM7A]TLX15910.1 hypothetical protein FFR93_00930 [Rhizobium sp. MHM7A]